LIELAAAVAGEPARAGRQYATISARHRVHNPAPRRGRGAGRHGLALATGPRRDGSVWL